MRAKGSRLWEHVGRRGAFLSFLSLLDVLYGYSILTVPTSPPRLHLLIPYWSWGYVWLAAGIVLFPGIWVRRDRFFYAVAAFMKAAWAGAWVDVWVNDSSVARAWVSVLIWAAFAALVLVVSTWPEVLPLKDAERGRDG